MNNAQDKPKESSATSKDAAQIHRYTDRCNNLLEEEQYYYTPRAKTPDDILDLVEGYRMELFEEAAKEGKDLVSPSDVKYEDLYRRLLFTGNFTPLTAASAIYDLEEKKEEGRYSPTI